MEVIQTTIFEKVISNFIDEEEYRHLEATIVQHPEKGDIIPGSGGIRKLRWKRQGTGKRGGLRIIYYWITEDYQILMLYAYPKSRQEDLSKDQVKDLKYLVQEELK